MAILNLLTDRGDDGATLSEVAEVLGQSRATYVHVLASLAAGGFVTRRPSDRRYHLGPALIAPGRAAAHRFPALGATRSAIERLSREVGYAVFAFASDGDHARLVDAAWDPRRPTPVIRIGDLLPIEPPLGSVFIAWNGAPAIDAWIRRGPDSAATHEALVGLLDVARARGYVIELRPRQQLLHELVRLLGRGQQMRRAERIRPSTTGVESYLSGEIDFRQTYEVSTVSVPVFDNDGRVSLALNLFGFDEPLSGRVLDKLGQATRETADRLALELIRPVAGAAEA